MYLISYVKDLILPTELSIISCSFHDPSLISNCF